MSPLYISGMGVTRFFIDFQITVDFTYPSVHWRCWLGGRKCIRPVKNWVVGCAGMVICLELGADLHMPQRMPLPLTVLASVKSILVLPFWYWLTWVVPEKGSLNVCVCVCVDFNERHIVLFSCTAPVWQLILTNILMLCYGISGFILWCSLRYVCCFFLLVAWRFYSN